MIDQAKRLRWAFALLLVVLAYLFAETRYPALNYDDCYLLGGHFPSVAQMRFFGPGSNFLFWQYDPLHNQFRTYGLARVIHFGLYQLLGTDLRYYYWIMAAMASTTALLAAFVAKSVTNSRAISLALASCCLLGPFALFQTFHHATYILLPTMATAAYLALQTGCATGRKRHILGGTMCVLVTMTGEVATTILLAAISILAICAAKTNDLAKLRNLLLEFSIVVTVLGVLYGYYRLEIFNPELVDRFGVDKPITWMSVFVALQGFNMTVLDMLTSSNAIEIIRDRSIHVDYSVSVVISLAIVVAVVTIVRSPEPARGGSLQPALFLIALYLTSFIVYVAVAAGAGISYYPPRYVQVSGFLLLAAGCLVAASVGSKIRKLALVMLVCLSGAGGILTFGMKVPTVEASAEFLRMEIAAAKANGGTRVMFIAPPAADGFINPYFLQPAASALTQWWTTENYCQLIWGVPCTHEASRELCDRCYGGECVATGEACTHGMPGDIVISATPIREGFMPALTVELAKQMRPPPH